MKKKILTALLSLVLAFGVWLYVVTVVSPESDDYYYVPVVYEGESVLAERGLMITSDMDATIKLRLSGARTDLKKLNNSNINVVVDLSRIYEKGQHSAQYTVSYPGDIPSNALEELSKTPDRISLTVEERINKMVPVKIDYMGSAVPEGYITDKENAELNVESIPVSGPASIIEKIEAAHIEVDLSERTESFSDIFRYTLRDKDGEPVDLKELVTTDVPEVRLNLKIERVKELPLKVNVISGGGADQHSTQIIIEPKTIRVSGNEKILDKLDYIELGTVDLGTLMQATVRTFPIDLPEGLTNLTGLTEAEAKISFPNLRIREMMVTKIVPVNVPEGMEVDMVTAALTVKLRGPAELVEKITADALTVTVDFSDAEAGTATFKAEVAVDPEFAQVGEMGTYSVSATLSIVEKE